jgi:hypothetical protein
VTSLVHVPGSEIVVWPGAPVRQVEFFFDPRVTGSVKMIRLYDYGCALVVIRRDFSRSRVTPRATIVPPAPAPRTTVAPTVVPRVVPARPRPMAPKRRKPPGANNRAVLYC